MNIELKPIAESKIRQMDATVHGVLVKNEAGAWAAVSEGGRVMWLDDFEGQAARVQPEQPGAGVVPTRDDLIQCLLATQAQSEGVMADAILSMFTTPQPQGDGWVKCSERLPEPRDSGRKAPNGILVKFDTGRITQIHDVTETLVARMKSGPRHPAKFEAPTPPRIVEWMDLDNPQPPKEGKGDE